MIAGPINGSAMSMLCLTSIVNRKYTAVYPATMSCGCTWNEGDTKCQLEIWADDYTKE